MPISATDDGGMRIRRLEPHEADLHRALRLRALHDAPESFADRFADVDTRPAAYWDDLTRSVTEPGRHVMFLAFAGDTACGCAYGLLDHEQSYRGRVGGMWVDPAHRRQGVGHALLRAVIGWARERAMTHLGLWAPAHNPAALTLYHHAGFLDTGRRQMLPGNPAVEIVEMERPV